MKEDILAFFEVFEEVFDRDWAYSKTMMGIQEETAEQRELNMKLKIESVEAISSRGTFLNPMVENETEDWGNRGELLRLYRILKEKVAPS